MKLFLGGSGDATLISASGPILIKSTTKLGFFGNSNETIRISTVRLNDLPLEERYQTVLENTIIPLISNVRINEIILTGDIKLKCNQLGDTIKVNLSGRCSITLPYKSLFSKFELKMIEHSKLNGNESTIFQFLTCLSNSSKCLSLIVTERGRVALRGGKCFIQMRKFDCTDFNLEMVDGGGKYDIIDISRFVPIVPLLDQHP
jgi:hypothetical protein